MGWGVLKVFREGSKLVKYYKIYKTYSMLVIQNYKEKSQNIDGNRQ